MSGKKKNFLDDLSNSGLVVRLYRQLGSIACPHQNQITYAASPPTLAKNARMGHPQSERCTQRSFKLGLLPRHSSKARKKKNFLEDLSNSGRPFDYIATRGFDHVSTTKANSTCSIATHPCEKRKDGAPSVEIVHAKIAKSGEPAQQKPPEWWEIACESDELKKCREDPRFPYLVTGAGPPLETEAAPPLRFFCKGGNSSQRE